MAGRPVKEFEAYLQTALPSQVTHQEYVDSPATALLRYLVEAKSAIDLCARQLPKKSDGKHTKDSADTLQNLIVASLPTAMSHFETFQRHLFARMFDLSVLLNGFRPEDFFKRLNKHASPQADWIRISAYRGVGAGSIGTLLADSLKGWQNPGRVNDYFSCFNLQATPFSKDDKRRLRTLWQLRHSIAHTGGTISLADSQKVPALNGHGDQTIAFEHNFMFELARKMHKVVKDSTERLGTAFKANLLPSVSAADIERVDNLFLVKSSVPVWLR